MNTYKKRLKDIIKNEPNTIKSIVASDILEDIDDYEGTDKQKINLWFKDLFYWGCQSGFITHLIYYTDTYKFFDNYYEEINELAMDYNYQSGGPLPIRYNIKNDLAWFSYETIADRLATELGLTI